MSARSKDKDYQGQITSLKEELQLSTFLNRGILTCNSEYQVRIAELERENAVLRVAESRLADTENALDNAESKIGELESKRRRWERDLGVERERSRGLELERDDWKGRFERVEGIWKELQRGMRDAMERPPTPIVPATVTPDERVPPRASSSSRKITSITKRQSKGRSTASPSAIPIPSTTTTKKRRRIHETPPEQNGHGDEDEDDEDEHQAGGQLQRTPSQSPRPPTPQPTRPRQGKKERSVAVATQTSTTIPNPPHTVPRAAPTTYPTKKRSSVIHNRRVSDDGKDRGGVKAEPLSPAPEKFKRRYGENADSDDDPLAMG